MGAMPALVPVASPGASAVNRRVGAQESCTPYWNRVKGRFVLNQTRGRARCLPPLQSIFGKYHQNKDQRRLRGRRTSGRALVAVSALCAFCNSGRLRANNLHGLGVAGPAQIDARFHPCYHVSRAAYPNGLGLTLDHC